MSEASGRGHRLLEQVRGITSELSGSDVPLSATAATFMDLGFDSLFLTQLATRLGKEFKVRLKLRQLSEDLSSIEALARHLDATLPPDAALPPAAAPVVAASAVRAAAPMVLEAMPPPRSVDFVLAAGGSLPATAESGTLQYVFSQQLEIMAQQLAMLAGRPAPAAIATLAPSPAVAEAAVTELADPAVAAATPAAAASPAATATAAAKPFGAQTRIERDNAELTPRQQKYLEQFVRRYSEQTRGSKSYTQQHRARLADPRAVSGFNPRIKELVYPIVAQRSQGARIWDLDGNEYIDAALRLRLELLRPRRTVRASRRSHEQLDARLRDRPAAPPRRRGRQAVLRDHRPRPRGVLQHRLGGRAWAPCASRAPSPAAT